MFKLSLTVLCQLKFEHPFEHYKKKLFFFCSVEHFFFRTAILKSSLFADRILVIGTVRDSF